MAIKYLDPWKDDLYGKLRGDKSSAYFSVQFKEAVVYKTDNAFIIAGFVTDYEGVERSWKSEDPLVPGLCAIPIYGQEYKISRKGDDGKWTADKVQPSKFEKALYGIIADNEDDWMPHNAAIKLDLTHIPDMALKSKSDSEIGLSVTANAAKIQIDLTGSLPEYKPPTNNSKSKGGNWSKGLFPEEKVAFLIKQLQADIKDDVIKESKCLGDLVDQMIVEHADNAQFIEIYFDMLIACVR